MSIRWVMVLTENDAIVDSRDLAGLVELAVTAERCGVDAVMLSDHIALGPSAGANGVMANLRDYAAPGNQDPATAWPSSLVLMSAIAQATTTLRLVAGAIIFPLRHPLALAKDLGTLDLLSQGRLVVLPTVSWHDDEYAALGVPFSRRGAILDEQLDIVTRAWQGSPISHEGEFYQFDDVWLEPGPFRPGGPPLWFGGQGMHPPLVRRIVQYGSGLNPFGALTAGDLGTLKRAMTEAGRAMSELELVGGIRGRFDGPDAIADLDEALEALPRQVEQGYTSICFKPAMFCRTVDEVPDLIAHLIARGEALTG